MGGGKGKNKGGERRSAARCSRSAERTKGPARPAAAPSPAHGHESGGRRLLPESPLGKGAVKSGPQHCDRGAGTRRPRDGTSAKPSGARPLESRRTPQRRTHRPPHGPSALSTAVALRMRHHHPRPRPRGLRGGVISAPALLEAAHARCRLAVGWV